MDFLTLAQKRYSTKKYTKTKKLSEEQLNELKEILRLSPSSINSQPWNFIFIENDAVKASLAEASFFNENKIKDASHLVVFCAEDSISNFEEQIINHLPEGSQAYYNQFIKTRPEQEIKAWMQHQVYISLGYFLSACAAMGIDSTPMEGIDAVKYGEILNLKHLKPLFAVAIGYRDSEDSNQPSLHPKTRQEKDKIITVIK
ncbi:nitroreductase family protein [Apibacter raozihei]|uniref:nitroreductase family protein n=1 Tax=Apibacter TaxID=1778601 RepID=UPI000FE3B0B5|nr:MULTISPECIES: nitroreductase family protein [Apibacter]